MAENIDRVRTPTPEIKKSAYKKKLYRKRTMSEVKRSLEYGKDLADKFDDDGKGADESTVDLAVDTAVTAGSRMAEYARNYSNKLKSDTETSKVKNSERMRPETDKKQGTATSESKKLQKEKIKRDYAKAANRNAKSAGKKVGKAGKKAAEETESAVSAALQKIGEFIAEHPVGALITALVIVILLVFMCTLNSCGMVFGGVSGGSVSATYTAEDADIRGAEADYKAKEAALQTKMNNYQSLYPGYDEYRSDFGSISHDAWHLASVLTVIHQDFARADVQGTLTSLFNAQYSFTVTTVSETRYRTERRTGYTLVYDYDEDGVAIGSHYEPYTYYVQVPYTYTILTAKMVNNGLDNVINNLGLSADDLELYEYLNQTKGEKAHLF